MCGGRKQERRALALAVSLVQNKLTPQMSARPDDRAVHYAQFAQDKPENTYQADANTLPTYNEVDEKSHLPPHAVDRQAMNDFQDNGLQKYGEYDDRDVVPYNSTQDFEPRDQQLNERTSNNQPGPLASVLSSIMLMFAAKHETKQQRRQACRENKQMRRQQHRQYKLARYEAKLERRANRGGCCGSRNVRQHACC